MNTDIGDTDMDGMAAEPKQAPNALNLGGDKMVKVDPGDKDKLITVYLGSEPKSIEDGEYTMEQLVTLLGATEGYVLSVKHGQGKLEPMVPGVPIKVHPNMKFIAQPPDGNWS